MGLFEYLFERRNPGKVGNIHENKEPVELISVPMLIVKVIVSSLIIYVLYNIFVMDNMNVTNIIKFSIVLLIYCFVSYKIIPQPDASNVGLFGGLIDHPFKFTDDINRFLIVLSVLLYPGRLIATTLIQVILSIKQLWK
jgi:hypothetical protein